MKVTDLRSLARQLEMRGYSRLRKDDLIDFIKDNLSSRPPPRPAPRPAPRPTQPRHPSVRFRPDRPRQRELLRKLDERNPQPPPLAEYRDPRASAPALKPYQLKPKKGKETFIEPLMEQKESHSTNPKKLKRMKKKLDELNRKIRHSGKKNNGLIHKRNSLKKAIEDLCLSGPERALSVAPNQSPCQSLTGLLRSVSKLSEGLIGVIGLMVDLECM